MEHSWDIGYKQAVSLQKKLAEKILLEDCFKKIEMIAGADVRLAGKGKLYCGILVFSYPDLQVIEEQAAEHDTSFPYIPGLLTFREGPAVLNCFSKLKNKPQLIFFDGNGYMHPRRLGLASHMGVLMNLPSIGVAKSKLLGEFREPGLSKGNYSLVREKGEVIGAALRTRDKTKPVFVSCGYKICLESAIKFTLSVSKYRIPEPTRQAHNYLKSFSLP